MNVQIMPSSIFKQMTFSSNHDEPVPEKLAPYNIKQSNKVIVPTKPPLTAKLGQPSIKSPELKTKKSYSIKQISLATLGIAALAFTLWPSGGLQNIPSPLNNASTPIPNPSNLPPSNSSNLLPNASHSNQAYTKNKRSTDHTEDQGGSDVQSRVSNLFWTGLEILTDVQSRVSKLFWTGLGIWSVYNLIDTGLANFLGLEILRHGTGPLGFVWINLIGGSPNWDGSGSNAVVGHSEGNPKKFFYVFKDSQFPIGNSNDDLHLRLLRHVLVLPRVHAMFSGLALFRVRNSHRGMDFFRNLGIRGIVGACIGLLFPTLKFKFTPEELRDPSCSFEDDPHYDGVAYRTESPIIPIRLGILGSLTQGINCNTLRRMKDHPKQVLRGASILMLAAFLAKPIYDIIFLANQEQDISTPITKNSKIDSVSPTQNLQNDNSVAIQLVVKTMWATIGLTIFLLNTF